jgi:hypothetical protein
MTQNVKVDLKYICSQKFILSSNVPPKWHRSSKEKEKGDNDTEMGKEISAAECIDSNKHLPCSQNILLTHLQQSSVVQHMNGKCIGSLQSSMGKSWFQPASRIHVASIYVQLTCNSIVITDFKQHDYIITLMIDKVKEPVCYLIKYCDILAKYKIQHSITCTSI